MADVIVFMLCLNLNVVQFGSVTRRKDLEMTEVPSGSVILVVSPYRSGFKLDLCWASLLGSRCYGRRKLGALSHSNLTVREHAQFLCFSWLGMSQILNGFSGSNGLGEPFSRTKKRRFGRRFPEGDGSRVFPSKVPK